MKALQEFKLNPINRVYQFLNQPISALADALGIVPPIPPQPQFTYQIGEYVPSEGGVVFHRYKDGNDEKYLIVSITNDSTATTWSNITTGVSGATSGWNGLSNSNTIVAQSGHTNSAANISLNSTLGGKNDWYLPSIDELRLLFVNRFNVDKTLSGNSSQGVIAGATLINNGYFYWSSTEASTNEVKTIFSDVVSEGSFNKALLNAVRSIRNITITP
jgi:hypothetical protein